MPGEPGPEHRQFEEMAVTHVMGGLDPAQAEAFRAHLLACAECRASVGELQAIAHELADVEQNEARERAQQTVELKELAQVEDPTEADGATAVPTEARRWRRVRLGGVIALIAFVLLGGYTVMLRTSHQQLEAHYADRLEAAAALEHGQSLSTRMLAPGVTATAKRNNEHLALLMEGLEPDALYGLYLMSDDAEGQPATTLHSQPHQAADGSILVLAELTGDERALVVTELEGRAESEPQGRRVFEAVIPADNNVSSPVGRADVSQVSSPVAR